MPRAWSREPRTALPSTATTLFCSVTVSDYIHVAKQASSWVGFSRLKTPFKGVVQEHTVQQGQEGLQPYLLLMAEKLDLGPAVGAADHGQGSEQADGLPGRVSGLGDCTTRG